MDRRRVLLVHGTAGRYGADRSLLTLAQGLTRRGWQVTAALGEDGPLADDLRAAGAEVTRVDVGIARRVFGRSRWLAFLFVELPRSVRQVRRLARSHDLVHINTSPLIGAVFGAWASRRPVLLHLRESWSEQQRMWRIYGRVLVFCTDAFVANSQATANELLALEPKARVTVVFNGMDFAPRRPAAPAPSSVLMVGRVNSWKGQDVLVRAVALLKSRGVAVVATIAGDVFPGGEQYQAQLEQQITEAGVGENVKLVGFVAEVDELLARNAVFVLPSVRPEPFGLALLEAMAQGRPCIATDGGGPRDIIRDGETGLLVPLGDHVALADAIERLLADEQLRDRLGEAAAADVRTRFAAERTVDGVEKVYEELLA